MCSNILYGVFILVVVQCSIGTTYAQDEDNTTRIVGGYETTIDRRPYVIQLHRLGKFICGGSIISPIYILTAAHCIYGFDADSFKVVANATFLNDTNGVERSVLYYSYPSGYEPATTNMDVALLRLDRPLEGVNIKEIALCTKPVPPNYPVTVSGWGYTEYDGKKSNQLRTVDVEISSYKKCRLSYMGRGYTFTDKMFCAKDQGKDSCSGDSGGPLVFNNKVCGIVSYGHKCAESKYPGVYTRVDKTIPFINESIKKFEEFFKTYEGGKYDF